MEERGDAWREACHGDIQGAFDGASFEVTRSQVDRNEMTSRLFATKESAV